MGHVVLGANLIRNNVHARMSRGGFHSKTRKRATDVSTTTSGVPNERTCLIVVVPCKRSQLKRPKTSTPDGRTRDSVLTRNTRSLIRVRGDVTNDRVRLTALTQTHAYTCTGYRGYVRFSLPR